MAKEKYFKVKKEVGKRAGVDGRMRKIVDNDFLLLSEKDIRNISLTVEEKMTILGGSEYVEPEITE